MKASSFSEIRALLLQVRNTRDIELQEQECFLERTKLAPHQLTSINVARDSLPDNILDGYHVLFIGGAGEYSAVENYEWMPGVLELVQEADRR
jgi:GMP synthase (glutamine-hydrolysing)